MSKRISLRDFQEGLVKRLTSAAHQDSPNALLGIQAGQDYWLLNLSDAGEIVPLPPLMSVPLTKPWFAGIANIRGVLYSVVDFAAWRGGAPTPINAQSRLLLIGARQGINSALLVRRALGLRPQLEMRATGEVRTGIGETAPWLGGRFKDAQDVVWTQLRIPALLADPRYLDIAL